MGPLTREQRDYKERTLNQLQTNLPILEAKLAQENRRDVVISLENQLNEMQAHSGRLQTELAQDAAAESVADEYCTRISRALSNEKFHLAKRYITKLEAIEPFYPGLERLKNEAESGRASRRTRSIAQGNALPYGAAFFASGSVSAQPEAAMNPGQPALTTERYGPVRERERRSISQFFQFHIVVSCLVVSVIICVMTGMGGMTLLQWLIEGQ